MAASQDTQARESLVAAIAARTALSAAKEQYTIAYLRAIRDGRAAGWSWRRVGGSLQVSSTAVRRFFADHRQEAGRLG